MTPPPAESPSVPAAGPPRRVLVVGSRGMLATDLLARLTATGFTVVGLDLPDIDITRPDHAASSIEAVSPALVINCAAYTAVDKAESEPEPAFAVNCEGSAHLASACARLSIPLIHISTDYVFDGTAERPYLEEDPANPLSVYGRSKWQGEEAIRARLDEHLIVRTAWLFGVHGHSFVKTVLRLAREREELRIVDDQHGCPTWTRHLADALAALATRVMERRRGTPWGTYHFCGAGRTTWLGFARAIIDQATKREPLKVVHVSPISTADYPTAAARPGFSVLDCAKIKASFGITPPSWQEGLSGMLEELYAPPVGSGPSPGHKSG